MLTPVNFWMQKTLPAVFDDSLSYYEAVCKLVDKINECIDAVNSLENAWQSYTDNAINNALALVQSKLDNLKVYIDQQDNLIKIELSKQISTLYSYVNELNTSTRAYTDNKVALHKADVDKQIAELKKYIDSIVVDTKIYNFFQGKYTTISELLYDYWNYNRPCGLTAGEYDSLQLTAQQYDNKYIMAYVYDTEGCKIFELKKVISPVTGQNVSVQTALNDLAGLHRTNGITAQAYDTLEFTAQVYDDKAITAYNYDYNGTTALSA